MAVAACAGGEPTIGGSPPAPDGTPREAVFLAVTTSGVSVTSDGVSFAAGLRNNTASRVDDVELRLALYPALGERIDTVIRRLAFCPARTECWWGGFLPGSQIDGDWKKTASIDVNASGHKAGAAGGSVKVFTLQRSGGGARGTAGEGDGTAYVIALRAQRPRAGVEVAVENGVAEVGASDVKRLGAGTLRGYFYVSA